MMIDEFLNDSDELVPVSSPRLVALPLGEDADEVKYLDAMELFENIYYYNIMRAIEDTENFKYGIVDSSIKEIKIREEYELTMIIDKKDESKNQIYTIRPSTDEEKSKYRRMYKHPESMFVALVSIKNKDTNEWQSKFIVNYEKGAVGKHVISFAAEIVQLFLDNSEFKTKREVSRFVDNFMKEKNKNDTKKAKEDQLIQKLSKKGIM